MSARDARARVEDLRAAVFEAGHPAAVNAEAVNKAATFALAAIEAGDLERFAEGFEALMFHYALASGAVFEDEGIKWATPLIQKDTIRAKQKTAASNPRSKPKQQARELWVSWERKPSGGRIFNAP